MGSGADLNFIHPKSNDKPIIKGHIEQDGSTKQNNAEIFEILVHARLDLIN